MEKKKKKRLLIGGLVLVILSAAYLLITNLADQKLREEKQEKENSVEQSVVLSLSSDQIRELSFEGSTGRITFVHERAEQNETDEQNEQNEQNKQNKQNKQNEQKQRTQQEQKDLWIVPGDASFVMNPARIRLLTDDLASLKAERIIENPGELQQYGLGEDTPAISVKTSEDSCIEIIFGIRNAATGELYFRVSNDAQRIYLTKTALDQHFSGSLKDFAQYEAFPQMEPSSMRSFIVSKGETSYSLDMPGDANCKVTDLQGNTQSADLNLVGVLQNHLANITWVDHAEYDCTDFSRYGLEEPSAVVEVYCENKEEQNAQQASYVLNIGKRLSSGNYYVRLNDSAEVHVVRGEYIEPFLNSEAASFWSRSYSFVSIGDLDHLDVTLEDETHTLRREDRSGRAEQTDGSETEKTDIENDGTRRNEENEKEENIVWFVDDREVEKDPFTAFYYACVSVTAQERLEEVPDITEQAAFELHYYLKDGTEKVMSYYVCDQNFYTVLYEGGTKAAHTNKIYVNSMIEKYRSLTKLLS